MLPPRSPARAGCYPTDYFDGQEMVGQDEGRHVGRLVLQLLADLPAHPLPFTGGPAQLAAGGWGVFDSRPLFPRQVEA